MGTRRARLDVPVLFGGAAVSYAYDALESGLVHAYSTRRVLASYTGDLLRLRRISDNAESDFGYDANGDLDTAAIATWIGASSARVVTLYDQKGGNNVTQGTAGNQPDYVASGQNGHPVLSLNGTSHYLQGAWSGGLSAPFTSLAVYKSDNASAFAYVHDSDDSTNRIGFGTLSGNYTITASSLQSTSGGPDTSWHVATIQWDNPNDALKIDGSAFATLPAGAHSPDGLTIGANRIASGWFPGDIPELIVWDPALSSGDLSLAEAAAASYWGITLS